MKAASVSEIDTENERHPKRRGQKCPGENKSMALQIVRGDIARMQERGIAQAVLSLPSDTLQGEEELRARYRESLEQAAKDGISAVAVPLLEAAGTDFPREEGLRIAVEEIRAFPERDLPMQILLLVPDEGGAEGDVDSDADRNEDRSSDGTADCPSETARRSERFSDLSAYIDSHYIPEDALGDAPMRMMGAAPMADAMASMAQMSMAPMVPMDAALMPKAAKNTAPKSLRGLAGGMPKAGAMPGEKSSRGIGALPKAGKGKPAGMGFRESPASERKAPLGLFGARKDSAAASFEDADDMMPLACEAPEDAELEDVDFEEVHESKLQERMSHLSDSFSQYLFYLIGEKHLDNIEVYKRALVDKKIFSKIKNNPDYHPQKITALCLCIGARLNLDETKDLLSRAGYALSPCDKTDIIFSYFIENGIYDMIELDIQLEEYGLPCIIA